MNLDKYTWAKQRYAFVLTAASLLTCILPYAAAAQSQAVKERVTMAGSVSDNNKAAIKAFNERLSQYVKMRAGLVKGLPKLSPGSRAADIEAHQAAFGERLQAARVNAKPGDVFTPDVARHIREVIGAELQGARLREWREKLQTAVKGVPLRVNYPYPEVKELVEMPPTLLLLLPELPKELRYYFAGKALLLVDHGPRLIVDYLPDVLP